jgi:hypothetical protein
MSIGEVWPDPRAQHLRRPGHRRRPPRRHRHRAATCASRRGWTPGLGHHDAARAAGDGARRAPAATRCWACCTSTGSRRCWWSTTPSSCAADHRQGHPEGRRLPEGLARQPRAPARRRRGIRRRGTDERVTRAGRGRRRRAGGGHGPRPLPGRAGPRALDQGPLPDVQVIGGNIATGDAAGHWRRPARMRSRSASARAPSAPRASSPASACRRSRPSPTSTRPWPAPACR